MWPRGPPRASPSEIAELGSGFEKIVASVQPCHWRVFRVCWVQACHAWSSFWQTFPFVFIYMINVYSVTRKGKLTLRTTGQESSFVLPGFLGGWILSYKWGASLEAHGSSRICWKWTIFIVCHVWPRNCACCFLVCTVSAAKIWVVVPLSRFVRVFFFSLWLDLPEISM